jgi:hypothetical protein
VSLSEERRRNSRCGRRRGFRILSCFSICRTCWNFLFHWYGDISGRGGARHEKREAARERKVATRGSRGADAIFWRNLRVTSGGVAQHGRVLTEAGLPFLLRGRNLRKGMPPGADVATAAHRQLESGTGGLRVANIVKGGQVKDMAGEKAGSRPGGEQQPVLSARERLRLHVNRNLALQQGNPKNGSDRGPASAGGPPAPPRGASPGKLLGQAGSGGATPLGRAGCRGTRGNLQKNPTNI